MPLSSSSSAQRCGAALRTGIGSLSAATEATGSGAVTGAGTDSGLAAGRLTYPHQLHDRPSFGIPAFGTPSTVPQAVQVIVARMDPAQPAAQFVMPLVIPMNTSSRSISSS